MYSTTPIKPVLKSGFSLLILMLITSFSVYGQSGLIKGVLKNEDGNENIPFATIQINPGAETTTTNVEGYFEFKSLTPGLYSLSFYSMGYENLKMSEILVTNTTPVIVKPKMKASGDSIEAVIVKISPFEKNADIPLSSNRLGIAELERNPGGNRDISKIVQSLPGVAQSSAGRNDLIIRGGGPAENRFFIEDIETPNINHFATQGASGGPVSMIDINYIRDTELTKSSFPANNYNALSSVMRIRFKNPRDDRPGFRITGGASDYGISSEGPIGKNVTYFASARRSYLQFLFKLIGLPFLPIYNDALYKINVDLDENTRFYTLFLGSYGVNELNLGLDSTNESQNYILSYLPSSKQWSYTNGYVLERYHKSGVSRLVFSRNMLSNSSLKYSNNVETPENLLQNYNSTEAENKFRLETERKLENGIRLNSGISYEYDSYTIDTYVKPANTGNLPAFTYNSAFNMSKYGAWVQGNKFLFNKRATISAGIRTDFNNYSSYMNNPLKQLSPRIGVSFALNEKLKVNATTGIYYQMPTYVSMGFRDQAGTLVNKDNGITYMQAIHYGAGFEYVNKIDGKFSVEGFWKDYSNYPFDLVDSLALVNVGSGFGVVGNTAVNSSINGKTYGLEFTYQQKLYKGFYGILAFTHLYSQFEDKNKEFISSAWDSRNITSFTFGKTTKNNWSLGVKFASMSGMPYTPYNVAESSLIANYAVQPVGIIDYDRLNSLRTKGFYRLDVRIDKKYYFKKANLVIYMDVRNATGYSADQAPYFDVEKDASGQPIVDPANPASYVGRLVNGSSGTVLPTLGLIFEF